MTTEDSRPREPQASSAFRFGRFGPADFLAVIGVISAVVYAVLYLPLGPGEGYASMELRLVDYPALFLLYFIACYLVWRGREQLSGKLYTGLVLAGAVLFRVVVLSGPVVENSDSWRYLWEGKVALAGMNPYAAPPGDPKYEALRGELEQQGDDLFSHLPPILNSVRSIYGPVATGLFVLPHLLPWDRIWSLRLLMTCFDFGTVLVLMGCLASLRRAPCLALIYAWNPMCLDAFPDRAHIDAAMVFFLALAAWLMCVRRGGWASIAFGLALLVKVSPLFLALPFLRQGRLRFGAGLAAVIAVGAIPLVLAGPGSISGYREFAARWHNMDPIHGLVLLALQPLKHLVNIAPLARVICTVAAAVYAVWRTLVGKAEDAQWLLQACAAIAGAGLLLSPVVYPWYTAHLVVFLCFAPNPGLLLLPCATMGWFVRFWFPTVGSAPARCLASLSHYWEPWRWVAFPPVFVLLIVHWLRGRTEDP